MPPQGASTSTTGRDFRTLPLDATAQHPEEPGIRAKAQDLQRPEHRPRSRRIFRETLHLGVRALDNALRVADSSLGLSVFTMGRTMNHDPLGPLEARIVLTGLRILSILTFLAFCWFALSHLLTLLQ